MTKRFYVSYAAAAFHIGIYLFLAFAHASSGNDLSEADRFLMRRMPRELATMLPPDIFSQSDPFRYLLFKMIKLNHFDIVGIDFQNEMYQFPQRYTPYVKLFTALLKCWPNLGEVRYNLKQIKILLSSSNIDDSSPQVNIPLLLEPFQPDVCSYDILTDPDPPSRLLYMLLDTPKNEIQNLKIQLKNYWEQTRRMNYKKIQFPLDYFWYANSLWNFLRNESVLDDLKREVIQIQNTVQSSGLNISSAELSQASK